MEMFGSMGKNFWCLQVCFLKSKKYPSEKNEKITQVHLFTTTFCLSEKNWNYPHNLLYYTTELCSLNFVVIKLFLPIFHYSQDSMS